MSSAIAAGAGATAAVASWANVALSRRQWQKTQEPKLALTIIVGKEGVEVHISTAGPGVAIELAWAAAVEDQWAGGLAVPDRMSSPPGATRRSRTALVTDAVNASAVMVCADAIGRTHARDIRGRHRFLRSRRTRRPTPARWAAEVLKLMHPDVYPKVTLGIYARTMSREAGENGRLRALAGLSERAPSGTNASSSPIGGNAGDSVDRRDPAAGADFR